MKAIAAIRNFFIATASMRTGGGYYNDAGGNRMVEQQIPLKFTRSGPDKSGEPGQGNHRHHDQCRTLYCAALVKKRKGRGGIRN
ncbi:hypothetical protein LL912_10620 [Niabella sp. CC-SYL272]|uniref:hypothetical protein n=1 Tax=Niabella agricola TaxID=2891571 RepID=UPI001F1905B3|nr:hypothetical protein [Niabella agricola]MCF3109232.1 hypothetical protein [Niabella agricola]